MMRASSKSRAVNRKRRLARIGRVESKLEIRQDDPIFRLHSLSEPIGPITNAKIDVAIYGK
jgi:hypothetical protein